LRGGGDALPSGATDLDVRAISRVEVPAGVAVRCEPTVALSETRGAVVTVVGALAGGHGSLPPIRCDVPGRTDSRAADDDVELTSAHGFRR